MVSKITFILTDEEESWINQYNELNPRNKINLELIFKRELNKFLKDIIILNPDFALCLTCGFVKNVNEFYTKKEATIYKKGYCKNCTDKKREYAKTRKMNSPHQKVIEKYNGKCALCGENYKVVHHIIPVKENGENNIENLIPLCRKCHLKAHNNSFRGAYGKNEEVEKILRDIVIAA